MVDRILCFGGGMCAGIGVAAYAGTKPEPLITPMIIVIGLAGFIYSIINLRRIHNCHKKHQVELWFRGKYQ